jgi:pilus assembly protein CpaB
VKQKNLFLLVVAVGCGLLAAFLTTQMSARPAAVEQTILLVAAKELPVGTKLDKDKLAELIKKKKVNKADVPLNALTSEDELVGKTVTQSLRPDDFFSVSSVGQVKELVPPDGKHLYTIKLPYEAVGPWVQAGRHIDVVCTHKPPGTTVVRHIKLLPEILVMAVDMDEKPNPATPGKPMINTVTLAANLEESHWLQLAQDAGAHLRLLVRGPDSEKFTKLPDDELYAIFNKKTISKDDYRTQDSGERNSEEPKPEPSTTVVRFPVTVKEAKAGMVIDDEFLNKVMQVQPFAGPIPPDAIVDLKQYKGRVLIQDVMVGRYLTENAIGEKPKLATEVKPPEKVDPKVPPKVEPKPTGPLKPFVKKPVETWDSTIVTGSGTKKVRFVRYEKDGEWVFLGEVDKDGKVTPTTQPNNVQPPPQNSGDDTGGKVS